MVFSTLYTLIWLFKTHSKFQTYVDVNCNSESQWLSTITYHSCPFLFINIKTNAIILFISLRLIQTKFKWQIHTSQVTPPSSILKSLPTKFKAIYLLKMNIMKKRWRMNWSISQIDMKIIAIYKNVFYFGNLNNFTET